MPTALLNSLMSSLKLKYSRSPAHHRTAPIFQCSLLPAGAVAGRVYSEYLQASTNLVLHIRSKYSFLKGPEALLAHLLVCKGATSRTSSPSGMTSFSDFSI